MIDKILAWLGKYLPVSAAKFGLVQTSIVALVSLTVLVALFLWLWNSGVFAG